MANGSPHASYRLVLERQLLSKVSGHRTQASAPEGSHGACTQGAPLHCLGWPSLYPADAADPTGGGGGVHWQVCRLSHPGTGLALLAAAIAASQSIAGSSTTMTTYPITGADP
jgi:hypothetical protein